MIDTKSKIIDRRRLLSMGATVSGAALVAALPVLTAPAAATPHDPIVSLWAARNRLHAEARRILDHEMEPLYQAGDKRWRQKERDGDACLTNAYEVEAEILGRIPISNEGWLIQATILLISFTDGVRGDGMDEEMVCNWIDHFTARTDGRAA